MDETTNLLRSQERLISVCNKARHNRPSSRVFMEKEKGGASVQVFQDIPPLRFSTTG
jgi:hypothetical protein